MSDERIVPTFDAIGWDCPDCGRRNCDEVEIVGHAEEGGVEGAILCVPETVTCLGCLSMFTPNDGGEP